MNVIHKFSEFDPLSSETKGKQNLWGLKIYVTSLIHTLLRQIEQVCEILRIS